MNEEMLKIASEMWTAGVSGPKIADEIGIRYTVFSGWQRKRRELFPRRSDTENRQIRPAAKRKKPEPKVVAEAARRHITVRDDVVVKVMPGGMRVSLPRVRFLEGRA